MPSAVTFDVEFVRAETLGSCRWWVYLIGQRPTVATGSCLAARLVDVLLQIITRTMKLLTRRGVLVEEGGFDVRG